MAFSFHCKYYKKNLKVDRGWQTRVTKGAWLNRQFGHMSGISLEVDAINHKPLWSCTGLHCINLSINPPLCSLLHYSIVLATQCHRYTLECEVSLIAGDLQPMSCLYCAWSSPLSCVEPALKCPLRSVFIICRQECSPVMLAAAAAAAGGGNWYNRLPVLLAWGQERACKKIIAGSHWFWCVVEHVQWHQDVNDKVHAQTKNIGLNISNSCIN